MNNRLCDVITQRTQNHWRASLTGVVDGKLCIAHMPVFASLAQDLWSVHIKIENISILLLFIIIIISGSSSSSSVFFKILFIIIFAMTILLFSSCSNTSIRM